MIVRVMDNVYKKALLTLRRKKHQVIEEDNRSVIYNVDWFYSSEETEKEEEVSEKSLILDSFSHTMKERIAAKETKKLEENGAVVSLKAPDFSEIKININKSDLDELKSMTIKELSEDNFYLRYNEKNKIKVMFISDTIFFKDDYEGNEFNTLFSGEITKLFSNMVKAMKLDKKNFFLSGIKLDKDGEKSFKDNLLKEIAFFEPELIITLGVSATHGLLNIKDRLKDIHGQFYDFHINDYKTQIMPLFSPHLLGSAPNMKKIAWEDMQKAMGKLLL